MLVDGLMPYVIDELGFENETAEGQVGEYLEQNFGEGEGLVYC